MKILLISDTHYGCRSGNPFFYDYKKKFFDSVFFPLIQKFDIDRVIHMGDIVDNRKSIDFLTLHRMRRDFLLPLAQSGVPVDFIVGNHDSVYKSTIDLNAIDQLLHPYKTFNLIIEPTEINVDGDKALMLPWICRENEEASLALLGHSKARYCFGHLALEGFEERRGRPSKEGLSRNLFSHFDIVFSGHFHVRSNQNNIRYIGAPFAFDWSDYGDYRGVAVLDTDTNQVKYYRNPFNIFSVVEYNEEKEEPDLKSVKDTYCRVFVSNKKSETKLNNFINKIHEVGVIDLSIVDSNPKKIETQENIVVDEIKVTCDNYISEAEIPNREEVQDLFEKIYQEAERK